MPKKSRNNINTNNKKPKDPKTSKEPPQKNPYPVSSNPKNRTKIQKVNSEILAQILIMSSKSQPNPTNSTKPPSKTKRTISPNLIFILTEEPQIILALTISMNLKKLYTTKIMNFPYSESPIQELKIV